MGFIAVDDLVQNMTPEQRILVSGFYAQFNNRSAANRRIVNVEPLFFQGAIAASEFLIYAATKLYLCLNLNVVNAGASSATTAQAILYNEANAGFFTVENNAINWNGTTLAANYYPNDAELKNNYFSRVVLTNYAYIKFIGYRITLQ